MCLKESTEGPTKEQKPESSREVSQPMWEMHVKTTMRYHLMSTIMVDVKKHRVTSADQDAETWSPHTWLVGRLSGAAAAEVSPSCTELPTGPATPTTRRTPQRKENTHPHKNLHTNVQSGRIHKSQKVKPAYMSMN